MSTNIETSCMIEGHATSLHGCEEPMPDISKEKWLRKYTSCVASEILKQHPTEPFHLKNREVIRSYFEKQGENLQVYVFDLTKVSYYQNIKRVVQRGFIKSKEKRSRKRSRSIAPRGVRGQAACLSSSTCN